MANKLVDYHQCSPHQAIGIQQTLAEKVFTNGKVVEPGYIAGVDVSVNQENGQGTAAVVVMSYPDFDIIEITYETCRVRFPYIPGLLSFRELPLIIAAFDRLHVKPGLVIVDGHGIAHPRRLGIASHFGLMVDIPVIGCAKSVLCGQYRQPAELAGSHSPLIDKGEVIGNVLRTKQGVRPVFVSSGNRIDLDDATKWVAATCRSYRLPEPVRQAHLAAGNRNCGKITREILLRG